MKKLLFVLLAVLMTSASFAQFARPMMARDLVAGKANSMPTWAQIGPAFTATDINGNTVSLQALLDQGEFVVVDYSATWCPPCWSMHNAGVLETFHAMEGVTAIFVEMDASTTHEDLLGTGSNTQGNWTVDANNNPVPYSIIEDDAAGTCMATCRGLYEGYVPSVFVITPDGYYCSIYATDWGIESFDASYLQNYMTNLMSQAPRANQAPIAQIGGARSVVTGTNATFVANYVSVDQVTGINWTFQNGNPATATGATATCSWSAPGTYTVTLEVTNTTGTTTVTSNVTVFDMDAMNPTYDNGGDIEGNIGTNGGAMYWGMKVPAGVIPAGKYMQSVELYVGSSYSGYYTLNLYQGGDNAPQTRIYSRQQRLTGSDAYQTVNVSGNVAVDNDKNLWITFYTNGVTYPAFYIPNTAADADWLSTNGSAWDHASDYGFDATWLIKGHLADSPNAGINEATNVTLNMYPNPTTGILNIDAEGVKEVSVIDVDGKVVMTENASVIDMTNLNNGVYFVRVISNEGMSIQKVVKK